MFSGEGEGAEVVPDRAVLGAGDQNHVGSLGGAAGAADLLVVGDRGSRGTDMDDESEVGFVEAHTEGRCRNERFDVVGEKVRFHRYAFGGVCLAGVGTGFAPLRGECFGEVLCPTDGEGVDDSRSGQCVEPVGDVGCPVGVLVEMYHRQVQGGSVQSSAEDEGGVGAAACSHTELSSHVGNDSIVRGGGGRENRDTAGELGQERADRAEGWPEVVTPV